MRTRIPALVLALFISSATVAQQDPAARAQGALRFSESMQRNETSWMKYGWTLRVELTLDGKPAEPRLYLMRFDTDGKLQKTAIGDPKKLSKKQQKWTDAIAELIKSYASPPPELWTRFFATAKITTGQGGGWKASGTGFVQPDDRTTFRFLAGQSLPSELSFTARVDKATAAGKIEYRTQQDGPSYPARMTVRVPTEKVTAIVETFEYRKQ